MKSLLLAPALVAAAVVTTGCGDLKFGVGCDLQEFEYRLVDDDTGAVANGLESLGHDTLITRLATERKLRNVSWPAALYGLGGEDNLNEQESA